MSKRNFSLLVTKRPRDEPIVDEPINFPPLGNLHLELLENKNKIKPGLPDIISPAKKTVIEEKKKPTIKEEFVPKEKKESPSINEKKHQSNPINEKKQPSELKKEKPESSVISESKKEKPRKPPKDDLDKEEDVLSLEEIMDDEDDEEDDEDIDELKDLKSDASEEEDEDDEEDEDEDVSQKEEEEKETKTKEKEEDDEYAGLTPEERERREKEEYMWRFRILKKKFKNPSVEIPDFNEHSELTEMKSVYERTTKELYLDNCVDSYRTYLMGGFMMVEFVCTNWLGVDLWGFTSSQAKMMYKYDMLLIELGEKSYSNWGAKIPVEIRLAGLILLQAGLFYLGKIISSKYGSGVADMFRGFTGQPPSSDDKMKDEPVKKKMKGPRFRAEDIREMSHVKKME